MVDSEIERSKSGDAASSSLVDRTDLIVAAVVLGLCAILFWDTTRWATVSAALAQNAPPTVFPRLLIGLVAILGCLLPFEKAWKRRSGETLEFTNRPIELVTVMTGIVVTLCVYLMTIVGIFPIMVAATGLLPILWGEKRYGIIAIYALAVPVVVSLIFAVGLNVNLAFGWTGELYRLIR